MRSSGLGYDTDRIHRMHISKNQKIVGFTFVIALIAAGGWAAWQKNAVDLDLPGVRYFSNAVEIPAFQLVDHNNQVFAAQQLQGRWNILFFGYTHCPDICPTALADLSRIYAQLQRLQQADDVQVVFVSVDPQRDTPETLKQYIEYFDEDFIAATGDKQQIDILAQRVGAIYDFEDRISGDPIKYDQLSAHKDYLVNHYSSLIVINPDGELVAHIYPPHHMERVVKVFNEIKNG